MHPHKWILNILPWQINFELDVLHPTIIDFTQGSATWAWDGGHGFETPCMFIVGRQPDEINRSTPPLLKN